MWEFVGCEVWVGMDGWMLVVEVGGEEERVSESVVRVSM